MHKNLGNNVVALQLNSDSGPSPAIWGGEPQIIDPNSGCDFHDDFLSFGGSVTSNVGTYSSGGGAWRSYEDTGGAIAQLATDRNGVIRIETDTTDNDECWMQPGGAASVMGLISDTAGDDLKLLFEARVRVSQITSGNVFVGMSEEGLAAADTITDAGAWADKDAIGFLQLEDDVDAFDFIYKKAGQTLQTKIAIAHTIVADAWVKLGFVYDPSQPTATRIKAFVNGVDTGTYVTGTNIAAATFPDGEELNALLGVKNSTGAAKKLDVDWVRVRQYRV